MKSLNSRATPARLGALLALAAIATGSHADQSLIETGGKVFREAAGIGCVGCHGEYGEGDLGVGPFLRGATEGMVRAAIEGTGEMIAVKAVIKEEEIAAVAAYVNYLGTTQVARTMVKRGRFLPDSFGIRPGTNVQLIIKNAGFSEQSFSSDNLNIGDLKIAARSTNSFIWQAPQEEGEYSVYCTDCKLKNQFFTIRVDATAKQFRAVVPASTVSRTGNETM